MTRQSDARPHHGTGTQTADETSSHTTYLARVIAIRRAARELDVLLGVDPGPRIPELYGDHGMALGVPEREAVGVAA